MINLNPSLKTLSSVNEVKKAIQTKYDKLSHLGTAAPNGIIEVMVGLWRQTYVKNGVEHGAIYYTKERCAFAVYGAIYKKYVSLRAEKSLLGFPITDETVTPDGVGRFNHFQGGSIYWTPKLGAFEIHGAIKDKWSKLGWERSFLGYPTTDELTTPDKIGRYTHFQGGSIYWTPTLGANAVRKEIKDEWGRRGWENGALGYPLNDTTEATNNTFMNHFQKGSISWSRSTGYNVVQTPKVEPLRSVPKATPLPSAPIKEPPPPEPENDMSSVIQQKTGSIVSLALANKLRMIFEEEDKFLVFHPGRRFEYKSLSFGKDVSISGLDYGERLNYHGSFSRDMNYIFKDCPEYKTDGDKFLWDELKSVLINADYVESILTEDETRKLEQAKSFLYKKQVDSEDGTNITINSSELNQYYQYKTHYDDLNLAYLDEKISVESATGDESKQLKQEWDEYREAQLREAKKKAEDDWLNLGHKKEVEKNLFILKQLQTRDSLNSNANAYLEEMELDKLTDTSGGNGRDFLDTYYSNEDAFDMNTGCRSLTLTKGEINKLAEDAPSDLKSIFNVSEGTTCDTIEEITFHYNEVTVMRPWFHPEFFESREWRERNGKVVSDGNIPRRGSIPAYISKILAVRNIQVTGKKAIHEKPLSLSIFGTFSKTQPQESDQDQQTVEAVQQPASQQNHVERVKMYALKNAQVNVQSLRMRSIAARHLGTTIKSLPMNIPPKNVQVNIQPLRMRSIDTRRFGTTIKTQPMNIPLKNPEPLTQMSNELITESYSLGDGVAVLAYVCKRLPKSPNPDETLNWNA